jgi:hypothetical protein
MNKLILKINAACLVILALGMLFIGYKVARLKTPVNTSNDTTIVIQQFYDTTIYNIQNVTHKQTASHYYKEYDTTIVLQGGECDSVRTYQLTAGNDTIEISGNVNTLGLLISHDLSYKWKLPYKTVETVTINKYKSGMLIGGSLFYPVNFGVHAGYLTRKGDVFSLGINTDQVYYFNYSKVIR